MRVFLSYLLAASLCAVAPPAFAKAASEKDPDQVVCKSKAKTNTRFPKKVCHTRAEWDQMSIRHQRETAEAMEKPVINPGCAGPGC